MICLTPKPSQTFLSILYKTKKTFYGKRAFEGKAEVEDWTKKWKEGLLSALAMVIKKDLTKLIRKHADEFKDHEKTVRTAIKLDLIPDLNPLDYAISGVLENKTNATSHPNIGSLKTDIE